MTDDHLVQPAMSQSTVAAVAERSRHVKSWDELLIANDAIADEAFYEALSQLKRELRDLLTNPARALRAINAVQAGILHIERLRDEP